MMRTAEEVMEDNLTKRHILLRELRDAGEKYNERQDKLAALPSAVKKLIDTYGMAAILESLAAEIDLRAQDDADDYLRLLKTNLEKTLNDYNKRYEK